MRKKGERTQRKILDTAAYCLARYGEHGTTFQKIADHCGLSQPYIVKFFKSRDEIFPRIFSDFVERGREETIKQISDVVGGESKLREYFEVSFRILFEKPESFNLYSIVYYYAVFDPRYKRINTEVKRVAVERIVSMLEEGINDGSFKVQDVKYRAKLIHNNMIGLFLNMISEESKYPPRKMWSYYVETTIRSLKAGC